MKKRDIRCGVRSVIQQADRLIERRPADVRNQTESGRDGTLKSSPPPFRRKYDGQTDQKD